MQMNNVCLLTGVVITFQNLFVEFVSPIVFKESFLHNRIKKLFRVVNIIFTDRIKTFKNQIRFGKYLIFKIGLKIIGIPAG